MIIWEIDGEEFAVGFFKLGMSLNEALLKIHHTPEIFFDLIYDEVHPFSLPIIIFIPEFCLKLIFNGVTQTLTEIVASDMKSIILSYQGKEISGPNCNSTLSLIYHTFPKTNIGTLDESTNIYTLPYNKLRLTCLFDIPEIYHKQYLGINFQIQNDHGVSPQCTTIIMKFDDVTYYQSLRYTLKPKIGMIFYNGFSSDSSIAKEHSSLSQTLSQSSSPPYPGVYFGNAVLDVVTLLGPPERMFVERNGFSSSSSSSSSSFPSSSSSSSSSFPMLQHSGLSAAASSSTSSSSSSSSSSYSPSFVVIHPTYTKDRSRTAAAASLAPNLSSVLAAPLFAGDYAYNYFRHGFDVFFDGGTHRVKKIVCHTNLPNTADFGVYARCLFQLSVREVRALLEEEERNEEDDEEEEEEEEEDNDDEGSDGGDDDESSGDGSGDGIGNDKEDKINSNNAYIYDYSTVNDLAVFSLSSSHSSSSSSSAAFSSSPSSPSSSSSSSSSRSSSSSSSSPFSFSSSPSSLPFSPSSSSSFPSYSSPSSTSPSSSNHSSSSSSPNSPSSSLPTPSLYSLLPTPVANPGRSFNTHPLQTTHYYGYDAPGVIFEVVKRGFLATVCLFKD